MQTEKMPSKLKALVDQTAALQKKIEEDGKVALKEAFKDFFDTHPEAKAIVWTQYTPHFNDGDACTFSMNEWHLKLDPKLIADDVRKALEDEDEDEDDYSCAAEVLESLPDTKANRERTWGPVARKGIALRALTEGEQSLVDDYRALYKSCAKIQGVFEVVLGDHVKVIATRKGLKTEDHSHD